MPAHTTAGEAVPSSLAAVLSGFEQEDSEAAEGQGSAEEGVRPLSYFSLGRRGFLYPIETGGRAFVEGESVTGGGKPRCMHGDMELLGLLGYGRNAIPTALDSEFSVSFDIRFGVSIFFAVFIYGRDTLERSSIVSFTYVLDTPMAGRFARTVFLAFEYAYGIEWILRLAKFRVITSTCRLQCLVLLHFPRQNEFKFLLTL